MMMVWSKKPSKRHVRGRTRPKRWRTCNFGTLVAPSKYERSAFGSGLERSAVYYADIDVQNEKGTENTPSHILVLCSNIVLASMMIIRLHYQHGKVIGAG